MNYIPLLSGFTILEDSKIVMYDHHYNYVMKHYPKAKLLFTDTDRYLYINLYIYI